jgi:hypothetical protein
MSSSEINSFAILGERNSGTHFLQYALLFNYEVTYSQHTRHFFGHNDETKECLLYNKKYENYIVKKNTKKILNNMIDIIIINEEREKKNKLNNKNICTQCNKLFLNNNCKYKKCKICCNCKNHKKKKLII